MEILGQAGAPVIVGIDTHGKSLTTTSIAIDDGASEDGGHNLPLMLQNVWLNGTDVGVRVGPAASVSLDTVAIGSAYNSYLYYYTGPTFPAQGKTGILCAGDPTAPAVVTSPDSLYSPLTINSQTDRDIDVEGYCQMSLGTVTLGAAASYPAGIASCAKKMDATGVYASGSAGIDFAQLTVQCMDGWGAYLVGTDAGPPVVTVAYGTLQNCGCGGVYLAGGARLTRRDHRERLPGGTSDR